MTNKEYQDFLKEVAVKTDKLFKINKRHVTNKINDFIKQFDKWRQNVFESQKKALKDTKLISWKDESFAGRPEGVPKNYILYDPNNFYGQEYILEGIKGCFWAAELPSNPVDTLRYRDILSIILPNYSVDNYPLSERKPLDHKEDLLRKYFLLAVIHANRSHSQPFVDCDCEPVILVWGMYESLSNRQVYCWETAIRTLVESALNDITADINISVKNMTQTKEAEKECPKETEQSKLLGKLGWIQARFKKVIEKAWQIFTKSFWETVFDRIFPK